jgi:oxaloacetate decarboxylase alpha subunit
VTAPARNVRIVDTTLRDAHQCLWATRMTTPMMLPVLDRLNRAGFAAFDLMGTVQFDVCVRYLREDPWERIRLVRRRIDSAPLKSFLRSKSLASFDVLPDDVNELWVDCLARNGITMLAAFDALADLGNIVPNLRRGKALGMQTVGALVFCESPVHTDTFFAGRAKALVEQSGCDWLMLKDSCGLLTPARIRTLVPALRGAIGGVPIELHGHCMTGLAPLVYHEAVRLGVEIVDTSIAPLANGPAQPATQTMVRNLRILGYEVDVDLDLVGQAGEHFRRIAEREGKPLGVPMAYDAFHFEHQVPGGMLTNLQYQLAASGIADRMDAVLHEIPRIRQELGWPIMVTPFAQLVVTQAVLNVLQEERYRIVPDEIKKYALGYYGKLLAPVDPAVLDRIVENGSDRIARVPEPPEPALPGLRRKYPNASDEERLLRFMFAGDQVDTMRTAGAIRDDYRFEPPLERLLRELGARRSWRHVRIERPGLLLQLGAG